MKPYVDENIREKVNEVLESGYLTEGPVTRAFEKAVADFTGAGHALAVCNCTVGLEMALRALGVGPGDEVIVPDYTYPATADAAAIVGATIVLVDIRRENMLVDYDAMEAAITPKTKALMPVSLFGNPLDANRMGGISEKTGIPVVEDAACSIGAEFKGHKTGSLADISVFSHHPRKFITTGEGGTITTNDDALAAWMDSYKHFGMEPGQTAATTKFTRIGTNYKLSNLQAAVGLGQMARIATLLAKRRELAGTYRRILSEVSGVTVPEITKNGLHSWQSFVVFVEDRDRVIMEMAEEGIETQIGTFSLHMHEAFAEGPACRHAGDMANSRWAFDHALTLPLYHDMEPEEQVFVARALDRITG